MPDASTGPQITIVVRAVIEIALVGLLRIGALLGGFPPDWVLTEDAVQDWIDRALAVFAAYSAWRAVTPAAAPRDKTGRELVPGGYPPR